MGSPATRRNNSACFQEGARVSILNLSPSSNSEDELKKRSIVSLRSCSNPFERIRYNCFLRGISTVKDLARYLRLNSAENGQTVLTTTDISKGLEKFGMELTESDLSSLEKSGNDGISLANFVDKVKPPLNSTRKSLLEKIFATIDKDGKGYCTKEEFLANYNHRKNPLFTSGTKTKSEVLETFLKSFNFDAHEDGKITKEDFFNYYAAYGAAIESDIYFDLIMRNSWNI